MATSPNCAVPAGRQENRRAKPSVLDSASNQADANPTNGAGHEMVVRPGTFSSARGAYIAQAGLWNTNGAYVRDVLPANARETYWIHD